MPLYRIRDAADLLGVSYDTVLRWADGGRIEKKTDSAGRLAVDGEALAKLALERAESAVAATAEGPVAAQSVRNRFTGLVTKVLKDTVMAHVEIQSGPHRFVSLMSREAADELGLEPGMLAVAAVKSTNVSVEIPSPPSASRSRRLTAPIVFLRNGSRRLPRRPLTPARCGRGLSIVVP